jgi:penicillin-binding protein 2
VPLAWNVARPDGTQTFQDRVYTEKLGFSNLVGYVSYPQKDKAGTFWKTEFIGRDGVEKKYNEQLKGVNGLRLIEMNVKGDIQSHNMVNPPIPGDNLVLSVDSRIQSKLHEAIAHIASVASYQGGAGVIMDIHTGEVIALTSYPEYDQETISRGENRDIINGYFKDKRTPLLNRATSGLYSPGSIVKPFVAMAVLQEGVINPLTKILSTGSISIPNQYFPDQKSIFKDWKAHGWVDMRRAIAVSSDVYFYEVTGGFEDQKGIGIANLEKYSRIFGLGEKTGIDLPGEVAGVIPNPEWKKKNFKGDIWRVGDTYNTSIGQYGYQITPVQAARSTAAIANKGTLLYPRVLTLKEGEKVIPEATLPFNQEYYTIIYEGMRQTVLEGGTAPNLLVPGVDVAAKTGSAQVGLGNTNLNSWIIGFFPYENPKYSFAVVMDRGPKNPSVAASAVMSEVFNWMVVETPEYVR